MGPRKNFQVWEFWTQTPLDCWHLCLLEQDFPQCMKSWVQACSQLSHTFLGPRTFYLNPVHSQRNSPSPVSPHLPRAIQESFTVLGAWAKPPSPALCGYLVAGSAPYSTVSLRVSAKHRGGSRWGGFGGLGLSGSTLCSWWGEQRVTRGIAGACGLLIFVSIRGLGRGMRHSAAGVLQQFGVISNYFKLVGTSENWSQSNLSGL